MSNAVESLHIGRRMLIKSTLIGVGALVLGCEADPEYKKLPAGNVAVISYLFYEGRINSNNIFHIQIGQVKKYLNVDFGDSKGSEQAFNLDSKTGKVNGGFYVPLGINNGIIGITRLQEITDIKVVTTFPQFFTDTIKGPVNLLLIDKSDITKPPLRQATVDASVFLQNGFDLNQTNIDHDGEILNPSLSQILYDFQIEQGQFKK